MFTGKQVSFYKHIKKKKKQNSILKWHKVQEGKETIKEAMAKHWTTIRKMCSMFKCTEMEAS